MTPTEQDNELREARLTHDEFEKRLDSIFLRLWNGDYDAPYEQTLQESKQAIKQLFRDSVGEDVVGFHSRSDVPITNHDLEWFSDWSKMVAQNDLRQQLRTIIGDE